MESGAAPKSPELWDRVGLIASLICVVHCTLTPVFVFFLPILGKWFQSPAVHLFLAAIVVPVGAYAFLSGFKHHKKIFVLALGLMGLLAISAGLFSKGEYEIVATILGGLLLSTGHILNLRFCHECEHS